MPPLIGSMARARWRPDPLISDPISMLRMMTALISSGTPSQWSGYPPQASRYRPNGAPAPQHQFTDKMNHRGIFFRGINRYESVGSATLPHKQATLATQPRTRLSIQTCPHSRRPRLAVDFDLANSAKTCVLGLEDGQAAVHVGVRLALPLI